jgi:hypothetical protein
MEAVVPVFSVKFHIGLHYGFKAFVLPEIFFQKIILENLNKLITYDSILHPSCIAKLDPFAAWTRTQVCIVQWAIDIAFI